MNTNGHKSFLIRVHSWLIHPRRDRDSGNLEVHLAKFAADPGSSSGRIGEINFPENSFILRELRGDIDRISGEILNPVLHLENQHFAVVDSDPAINPLPQKR